MADRNVDIRINTSADSKGVDQVSDALDKVGDNDALSKQAMQADKLADALQEAGSANIESAATATAKLQAALSSGDIEGAKDALRDYSRVLNELSASSKLEGPDFDGSRAELKSMAAELDKFSGTLDKVGKSKALDKTEKDARDATKTIDALEKEIAQVNAELRKTEIGSQRYTELSQRAGELSTSLRGAERPTRNTGLAVLELSRAVEDAQYGIRGVLNNIPGLITMLGGTGGLAGVVSLVAVGLTVLGPKIAELFNGPKENGVAKAARESAGAFRESSDKADRLKSVTKELSQENDNLRKSLDDSLAAYSREDKAITANLELLDRQRRARLELSNAELALALSEIDLKEQDGTLNEVEAEKERIATRRKFRNLENKEALDALNEQIEAEKKRLKVQQDRAILARQEQDQAKKNAQELIKLQEQLDTQKQTLLSGQAAVEGRSTGLNDFYNILGFDLGKAREDFGDDIDGLRDFVESKLDNLDTAKKINLFSFRNAEGADAKNNEDTLEFLLETITKLELLEDQVERTQNQIKSLNSTGIDIDSAKAAESTASNEIEDAKQRIELLNEELKVTAKIQEVKGRTSGIQDTSSVKQAQANIEREEKKRAEDARKAEIDRAKAIDQQFKAQATQASQIAKSAGASPELLAEFASAVRQSRDGTDAEEVQDFQLLVRELIALVRDTQNTTATDELRPLWQELNTLKNQLKNNR